MTFLLLDESLTHVTQLCHALGTLGLDYVCLYWNGSSKKIIQADEKAAETFF